MAENDIYNSEKKYNNFKDNLNQLLVVPPAKGKRKYYCKNASNLEYFKRLCSIFEARDISFIRRLRLLSTMKFLTHGTEKDLSLLNRDDVNAIMAIMHQCHPSPKSKRDSVVDIKFLWGLVFCYLFIDYPTIHWNLIDLESKQFRGEIICDDSSEFFLEGSNVHCTLKPKLVNMSYEVTFIVGNQTSPDIYAGVDVIGFKAPKNTSRIRFDVQGIEESGRKVRLATTSDFRFRSQEEENKRKERALALIFGLMAVVLFSIPSMMSNLKALKEP